jgi:hypothetical protein
VAHLHHHHLQCVNSEGLQKDELWRDAFSHVYVLRCEELDSYKNQVKGRLRAWVDEMNERGQQWLVLYMPMGARSSSKGFLSKGGTAKVRSFALRSILLIHPRNEGLQTNLRAPEG